MIFLKKTLSVVLSLLLLVGCVAVAPVSVSAATEKVTFKNGAWIDAKGYQLIALGSKRDMYIVGVYDNYLDAGWSNGNSRVLGMSADFDYCRITARKEGYATVTGWCTTYYRFNKVYDERYTQETYKFHVVKPIKALKLPKTQSVTLGKTVKLKATYTPNSVYSFYASNVKFTSSNKAVATVSSDGTVTPKKPGTVTITAKSANGLTAQCKVTVKRPVLKSIKLNKTSATIGIGKTLKLAPTYNPTQAYGKVTYTTSNKKIATVTAAGTVKGIKAGTVTITARVNSKIKATCKITVAPYPTKVTLNKSSLTLATNKTYTLKHTFNSTKARADVTWSSSNTKVAKVNSKGKITPIAPGKATITIKTANGKKDTCKVTVRYPTPTKVNITKSRITLSLKETATLNYEISPTKYYGTPKWTSSDTSVVKVNSKGKITPISLGTATITLKVGSKSDTCKVVVNRRTLDPAKYLRFKTTPCSQKRYTNYKEIWIQDASGQGFSLLNDPSLGDTFIEYYSSEAWDFKQFPAKVFTNAYGYDNHFSYNWNYSKTYVGEVQKQYKLQTGQKDQTYLTYIATSGDYEFMDYGTSFQFFIIFDGLKYQVNLTVPSSDIGLQEAYFTRIK